MIAMPGFPEFVLDTDVVLYRMHRSVNGPFFFGNTGWMRFDPAPSHVVRFGTCYVAPTRIACLLEVVGDLRPIPRSELELRQITEFRLARPLRLANLLARPTAGRYMIDGSYSAGRVGLSGDIDLVSATGRERDSTRQFASDRFDEGFDGISYKARHDPALQLTAFALFSRPGGAEHPELFVDVKPTDIDDDDIRRLSDHDDDGFGYDILD